MSGPAIALIRQVIRDHGPLTGKEIYRLVKQAPAASVSVSTNAERRDPTPAQHDSSSSAQLVPSLSFLKKHVFPEIKSSREFELKHVKRSLNARPQSSQSSPSPNSDATLSATKDAGPLVSTWVWQLTPADELEELDAQTARLERRKSPPDPLRYNASSDVLSLSGAPNIEHLNRRRQRARLHKAHKEHELIRQVEGLRIAKEPVPELQS